MISPSCSFDGSARRNQPKWAVATPICQGRHRLGNATDYTYLNHTEGGCETQNIYSPYCRIKHIVQGGRKVRYVGASRIPREPWKARLRLAVILHHRQLKLDSCNPRKKVYEWFTRTDCRNNHLFSFPWIAWVIPNFLFAKKTLTCSRQVMCAFNSVNPNLKTISKSSL